MNRAPVITRIGPGVRVLLEVRGAIAAIAAPGVLATSRISESRA